MSLPQGSRPPSSTVIEDSKDGSRKANTDSGFHEDDHSTPTVSSSGGKRNYRHHRRKAGEDETDGDGDNTKDRHDSLASMFSDMQDFINYMGNTSDSSSLSSRIKYSASSTSSVPEPRVVSSAPQNVPRRSDRPSAVHHTNSGPDNKCDDDYEFPSDTELSEIIAIMSGIATPRKSLKDGGQSRSMEECPSTPITIHSDHYASSQGLSIDDDDDVVLDVGPTKEGTRLYEKNNAYRSNNGKIANGKVSNGTVVSRRYLPKGVSVESTGSVNGTAKETTLKSLEDILRATQNGKFPDKEAAKKNKDNKKKDQKRAESAKKDHNQVEDAHVSPSWKQRLKVYLTFIVSVGLILSGSSLLFIVPMFVDPILAGLEAQFSTIPTQCRTIRKRNGTGATDCAVPSCREGCTADMMFCYFIDVEYQTAVLSTTTKSSSNEYLIENGSEMAGPQNTSLHQSRNSTTQGQLQEGVLLVNPNGCGYPPETNCTEFGKHYGRINYTFPCYISGQNDSIVVPHYSHRAELLNLSVWLLVPCGMTVICSAALFLLLRWKPASKRKKKVKDEELEVLHKNQNPSDGINVKLNGHVIHGPDDGTLRLNLNPELATAPPMPLGNGTLGNIMSDLTGITSNNFIKKRHYAKFKSSSTSIPNSTTTSRVNSVAASRTNSFDAETEKHAKENNSIPKPNYSIQETKLDEQPAETTQQTVASSVANGSACHTDNSKY